MKYIAIPHPSLAARRAPSVPSRGARRYPAAAPARPQTAGREPAASRTATPANTATRWERQNTRVRWVESVVLVIVMAYFGGGLAAMLSGS